MDNYTHAQMVKLCDESKEMMLEDFTIGAKGLFIESEGRNVELSEILEMIDVIKSENGISI